mmetsp:Transcript_6479/g.12981  ORF Transcript_6479/g.12981 Transcript_6479/m.12981 type:complete len:82 (-) Transcript_6479:320-565(-)
MTENPNHQANWENGFCDSSRFDSICKPPMTSKDIHRACKYAGRSYPVSKNRQDPLICHHHWGASDGYGGIGAVAQDELDEE